MNIGQIFQKTRKIVPLEGKTGNRQIDKILEGIVGIYKTVFPKRIRGYYLLGSHANGTALERSDIDLVIRFKGHFQNADEVRKSRKLYSYCFRMSPIELHFYLYDEATLFRSDSDFDPLDNFSAKVSCHCASIKMGTLLVYGEDFRDQLPTPSVDRYMCGRLHDIGFQWATHRDSKQPLIFPLDYPNPNAEFYGYVGDPRGENLHDFVLHVGFLAVVLIILKAGRFVGYKTDTPKIYAECINDEWMPLVEAVFEKGRNWWNHRVPDNQEDRKQLREICQQTLAFENHSATVLKDYLLTQLQSDEPTYQLMAAHWLGYLIFPDSFVLSALRAVENHESERVRTKVKETQRKIQTVLAST